MSVTINDHNILKREMKECTSWPEYINWNTFQCWDNCDVGVG